MPRTVSQHSALSDMKCPSIAFLFLLLLLLLALLCGPHHAYALEVVEGGPLRESNCHDSHNGFDIYPNPNPNANPSLMPATLPPTLAPTPAPSSSPSPSPWKCCCWNASNQSEEVECRCEGAELTRVPQTLKLPIQRLTIASTGLPRLRSTGLKVYAPTLLDVAFTDCLQLELIQDGAFSNLTLLRTIYISNAPKLTFLSRDVFAGISGTVEIIRIINSGLTSVPDLSHLPPYNILQMIDLDNNQITRIDTKSIKVKTAQFILANNDISYVDDSAFFGSKIAKLSLKDNRKLSEMHPNAFHGIIDITELDLSSTALVGLPSAGLQTIEALYIQNTHTLKTIPSIYNFRNLQRAYLTHSFHCCAFQFPSRHDPERHAQRIREIEKWRELCNIERLARKSERTTNDSSGEGRGWQEEMPEDFGTFDTDGLSGEAAPSLYASFDYMADTTINLGQFHEQITLNPDDEQSAEYCGNFTFRKPSVECYPMPNALNPCEDVMGYQWLRISVWIVVALAVVGNVAVLTVILSIRPESASVPRFLMCHLAFADLCLGLYLLLVACIDAHSMGEFFNYAYDWQYGWGGLQSSRIPHGFRQSFVGVHADRDYNRAMAGDYTGHAPEPSHQVAPGGDNHAGRLDLLRANVLAAIVWHQQLFVDQHLLADGKPRRIRHCLPYCHTRVQRCRLLHHSRVLCSDLSIAGPRDASRTPEESGRDERGQENGTAGLYQLCLLVAHCLLWPHRPGGLSADQRYQIQDITSILLSIELVRGSLSVCHTNVAVSPGPVHPAVEVSAVRAL
ncbi:follicle-stimulating hormone receptor isoform X4 [Drosophila persimilis]|uniref:follicle-stimulating hormone receptor isoform X4 n=1 Tax=Drosophila persimilis TaxID=7234 RepID=UPI000F093CCC|nr:follicle-stimulating hormone receptor isoform X4 [Drosophila persimilis]